MQQKNFARNVSSIFKNLEIFQKKFPFFFDDFQKGSIYQMRRKYSFSGTKTYKRGGEIRYPI